MQMYPRGLGITEGGRRRETVLSMFAFRFLCSRDVFVPGNVISRLGSIPHLFMWGHKVPPKCALVVDLVSG